MNKSDCSTGSRVAGRRIPGESRSIRTRSESASLRQRRSGTLRAAPAPRPPGLDSLLASLAWPTAEALLDPTDAGMVIVSRTRAGVSVGAGRFPLLLAEALVRLDLAAWSGAPRGQQRLRITEAGRANRRRRAAPPSEAFVISMATYPS